MATVALTPTPTLELTKHEFSRHDLIPLVPDPIWYIERGAVRTSAWDKEGTLLHSGYWGKGDVVGHPLLTAQPYQIYCLTNVVVKILPQELWQQGLNALLLHAQQTEELLRILHCQRVRQKLWKFLLFLSQKFGRDVEPGRLLDLPLTQLEIAQTIGTTRVTVTRMLQLFEAEGKLRRIQRQLILCQT